MENKLILPENYKQAYDKIVKMIETAKHKVYETANFQTVYLFWHIGQELKDNILNGQKAEYGISIVKNMSKDLENAILVELEKFILEMGTDFAFMARQKKVTIDGKDYKIDLLFFHRKLKRLVVVELKIGEFEPEDKAQVELYLRWLNKYERMENEEAPIALILCAEKSDEVIELLELDKGDIRVAQYLTAMPPKEELEEKLRLAIQRAKIQLEQRKE